MRFLKSGKVKDVYEVNDSELEFVFSDRISVFDKIIPSKVPFKGETLARTSAYWFEICKNLGIRTHYLRLVAPDRMRVRKVRVISDPEQLKLEKGNYQVPLECVVRYYLYGSLWDRFLTSDISSTILGFPENHKPTLGEKLPAPFFEVTTKLEKVDRSLTFSEAVMISNISIDELNHMKDLAIAIDQEIDSRIAPRGLIHVDGKKEFALDEKRNLIIIDTFGTADEDRFWDAKELKEGRFMERSKEFVRQYYREIGYHEKLMKARKEGAKEPPIPPLPKDMLESVSRVYIGLYEDLTGQRFR